MTTIELTTYQGFTNRLLAMLDAVETALAHAADELAGNSDQPELERYTPEELGVPQETLRDAGRLLNEASERAHEALELLRPKVAGTE